MADKVRLCERLYAVLDEVTVNDGKSCLLAENVVKRRHRYAEQRLSSVPEYEENEKIESVRASLKKLCRVRMDWKIVLWIWSNFVG